MEIRSQRVTDGLETLSNQGLIYRFLGARLHQQAIAQWVSRYWEIKGEVSITHYSNGYFLALFTSEEVRDNIFQGGPWFYGSVSDVVCCHLPLLNLHFVMAA